MVFNCPALPDQLAVDVPTVGMADGNNPPIPIPILFPAGHLPAAAYQRCQSIRCFRAAEIPLALSIVAGLLSLRRIDTIEADARLFASDRESVPVYHVGLAR